MEGIDNCLARRAGVENIVSDDDHVIRFIRLIHCKIETQIVCGTSSQFVDMHSSKCVGSTENLQM